MQIVLTDNVLAKFMSWLSGLHPGWGLAAVLGVAFIWRLPAIIKEFGAIRNERLKIRLKDERRRQKIRNALDDRGRKGS